ncbi:hypothetical protein KAR91_31795 [Candidatus Pacearchaeota archaeon]|nr:hypothetical protein [Candidatus Pacearchaeota archaeon]
MTKKEVIELFVSTDESKKTMGRSWVRDKIICATNGNILITVPENLIENGDYAPNEFAPKVDRVLSVPEWIDFDAASLSAILKEVTPKFQAVYEPCGSCCGEAGDECPHCGQDIICDSCNDSGDSTIKTGERIPKITTCSFLDTHFDWHLLDIVKRAMDIFGGTWRRGDTGQLSVHVFKNTANVQIAIMPIMNGG